MDQPLHGIRVVELVTGIAGPYTGKLLADFGADVVKVEPPGGDPARLEGPFPDDLPDPEQSALFLALGTNKRSVVLDPAVETDVDMLRELVRTGHIVIDGDGSEALDRWLPQAELVDVNPSLVRCSVSGFGLTGPYAGMAWAEIVIEAMAGPLHATGMADREPVKHASDVALVQAGNVAAVAALAALAVAETSGQAVHVDVAAFETQAGSIDRRLAYLLWRLFTGKETPRIGGHRAGLIPAGIYPTVDGYVQVLAAPNWLGRLADMLGDEEVIARLRRPDWIDDPDLPELLDTALHVWTLSRTRAEAMAEAQALGLGVTSVNPPTDVLADPHLRARQFWATVDHPVAGRFEIPGPPVRMAEGWKLRRPAPTLGQHGDEIRAELATTRRPGQAASRADAPASRATAPGAAARRSLPLEGVRVLDLTVVWAGPYCTMLLGDLGAEVIRVDNPNLFPTATRGAVPRPRPGHVEELGPIWGAFPDGDPGARPWNRVGAFVCHARNKLGVTLDLRTPLGRETFLRLVERSDVLVENNSAKVLDRLGLGWAELHRRNPRLVLVRMPSLGVWGPYAHYVGFGAHVEALCGLTWLRGYPDLDLTANAGTYHMDPASGTVAAFATMAALRRRARTGEGELVEVAQAENLVHHIGADLVDAARTGRTRPRLGNRHLTRAPQGVYRCAGRDRWVAISVADDDRWRALRRAMGEPAWAAATELDNAEGRQRCHDELDRAIEAWTSTLDRWEVCRRCQAEGVAAGPVLGDGDCLEDPHLRARGFFRRGGSVDLGEWHLPGHVWRWDGPPLRWGPVNRMGADNDTVLKGTLGVNEQEWAALEAEGHLSLDYVDERRQPL